MAPRLQMLRHNKELRAMPDLTTIATDALVAVHGGQSAAERAKAHVGSDQRCGYVKEHLGRLGANDAFMNRMPRISRQGFDTNSLKDRLQMEHFYNCRPRDVETPE
jgi:hypothetical protein